MGPGCREPGSESQLQAPGSLLPFPLSSRLMPHPPRRAPQVHKFGGASLADSAAVLHAVTLVRSALRNPTIVVVSAMAGVTDALLEVARQAERGDEHGVAALIAQLRSRHADVAR